MNTRIVSTSCSIVSLLLSGASLAQTQAPPVTLVTLPLPAGGRYTVSVGMSLSDFPNAPGVPSGHSTIVFVGSAALRSAQPNTSSMLIQVFICAQHKAMDLRVNSRSLV